MKIHECDQNSVTWLMLRAGVITASEIDALVSPLWKIRTGQGVESYLAQKLAERWTGGPLPGFMDIEMELGKIQEEEAIPAFEWETGESIRRVGFITSDDNNIGCSPDGLIGEDGGIEIKCPRADTAIKYLLAGEIPPDYIAQVHFSMHVTGRKWWKFMSYRRGMPMLVKTIQRDEKIQTVIADAVAGFQKRLDDGMARLAEMNGGKRPKHSVYDPHKYDQKEEQFDTIP